MKKKWSVKKIIIIVIAVLIALLFVMMGLFGKGKKKNVGNSLKGVEVVKEDLQTFIDGSGVVESNHKVTYFSPVNAKIGSFEKKLGGVVKSEEKLLSFDLKNLEENNQKAQISVASGKLGISDAIEKDGKANEKQAEAIAALPELTAKVEAKQEEVNSLMRRQDEESKQNSDSFDENKINELKSKLEDAERKLKTVREALNTVEGELDVIVQKKDYPGKEAEYEEKRKEKTKLLGEVSDAQTEVNILKAQSSALASDNLSTPSANVETTIALNQAQTELAQLQSELAAKKNIAETDNIGLTGSGIAQMKKENNLKELEAKSIEELIEEGKKGIISNLNGVISSVKVEEGATVTQGQELFTISALDDVCVKVNISKNDLEKISEGQKATVTIGGKQYEGVVEEISRIAIKDEKNNASLGVVVKVKNPDEHVYLGVDAKVKITGQKAAGALVVPIESVNIDKEGSFVYVLQNGQIEKKSVETGLSSNTKKQIISGLKEGEQIIPDIGEHQVGDAVELEIEEKKE